MFSTAANLRLSSCILYLGKGNKKFYHYFYLWDSILRHQLSKDKNVFLTSLFLEIYFKKAPLPVAYPNYHMVVLGAVY